MMWRGKEYGIGEIVLAIFVCVMVFSFIKGCHDKNERIWELEAEVEQQEEEYQKGFDDGYKAAMELINKDDYEKD